MSQNLHHLRKAYYKNSLCEGSLPDNPMTLFSLWFEQSEKDDPHSETNAFQISTLDIDGYPQSRIVLLKEFDEKGFVFFTNYNSQKGMDIANRSKVGLAFFWEASERQVIVRGKAEKTTEKASDTYFASRPRGSQLGAWASQQSKEVASRKVLENALRQIELRYPSKIPRPNHWGGYLVKPVAVEFWQGRPDRMHDRIRYTAQEKTWNITRISP